MLKTLLEQRDAAEVAYRAFAEPIITENRALTDDEETRRGELRSTVQRLDARILEVTEDEKRSEELAEARGRALAGTDDIPGDGTDVKVKSEPRTYGEGSPNSYYADLARSSGNMWKDHDGALARLNRHAVEVGAEIRSGSKEGRAQLAQVREAHRTENGAEARAIIDRVTEFRAGMDTTGGSGGSFATPQYFVSDYAPFRQFGRVFVDQCNHLDLPEYGMTVYLPTLLGPAGVASQVAQNTGINETDPTAGYLSSNLNTLAGQVTVSQQLLDRTGPNFQFDKMVFDQLNRAYAPQVDQYVLTQSLAGAATVAYPTPFGIPTLMSKIAGAKAAMATTQGTILPATHLFTVPSRWEYISAQVDTQNRPLVVPTYANPMNALAAGSDGTPVPEGFTGYKQQGLWVFEDGNIPLLAAGAQDQILVTHPQEVYVWEGTPVTRAVPQTYAQSLSVLLQMYSYVTAIVRYPKSIQSVQGPALGTVTF